MASKVLKFLGRAFHLPLLSHATTGYCSGIGEGQDLCLGAFQELCLAGRKQNFSALNLLTVLMPTAVLGGLRQRAECEKSSFMCQHPADLALPAPLSPGVSRVCLMQDEGQENLMPG